MGQDIICIYCKRHAPPSREHAFQRSLGGDLVSKVVCERCNNSFSRIDQALAERSPVSMLRVASTPEDAFSVKLGGVVTTYDENARIFVELELRNALRPVALPQLHLRPNGKGNAVAANQDAKQRLIDFIDANLDSIDKVHRFYGLHGLSPDSVALVVTRPNEGYIRFIRPGDEDWYFPMLQKAWTNDLRPQLVANTTIETPRPPCEVSLYYKYAPNDVYRAIAKSAFNVLAIKRGATFVLRPEFDSIRQYILGDVQLSEVLGTDAIALDQRFVVEIPEAEQHISFTDDEHAVVFYYRNPELIALVTLYGSHLYVVRFPEIVFEETEELFGHFFTKTRSGNQPLAFADIAERILLKHFGRIGITEEQARHAVKILRSQV